MCSESPASLTSLACVVTAVFPDSKENKHSACGVLLNPSEGILLCHGSILADFGLSEHILLSKIKAGEVISNSDFNECSFTVLLDKCWRSANLLVTQSPSIVTAGDVNANHEEEIAFSPLTCKFLGAFRNFDFHDAVCKTMPEDNWTFASGPEEDSVSSGNKSNIANSEDHTNSIAFQLLSYFVLLQCPSLVHQVNQLPSPLMRTMLAENLIRNEQCEVGSEAEIISTPFGGLNPHVFFNSYSRGVISNVSGRKGCWILTDARCIPGSEGGPLFTIQLDGTRQLAGMVVASLCWKNKEWVGLSLVCGINSVLSALSSHIRRSMSVQGWRSLDSLDYDLSPSNDYEQHVDNQAIEAGMKNVMPYVVLVKVGRVWGSGFVIDTRKGLVLTCSHVIKDASLHDPPILLRAYNCSRLFKASVIYRQTSVDIDPFDLAVLRCPEMMRNLIPSVLPKVVPPSIGQRVHVCGHAIFNTDLGLQPSVSSGVISKVVKIRGQDIMVQSTCAVHAGASGGPLLDMEGNLVGIVVCNTVDKCSNSTYPHVNFSVPAITVWPSVLHYIETGDASLMKSMKVTDTLVKKLWALDTTLETGCTLKSKL
ncbi:peroxisomal leader peptide-processing protease-like [Plakobranchus ocellatus]|uniref:Peroxisomal leader peptide-processing protease n=1 Tax=Plakobranchus ocellatus TaxID=259542 RepID=A0AAV4BUG6_9GAST|nr:peroxisomal leader peptide-processing protease-like [Plakobranchus ocellatus]